MAARTPRRATRPPVLGIDVGGVLVDRVAESSDTSFFGGRTMETPAVPGAFAAVAALAAWAFEHRVHIVSKAGPKIAGLTREWLGIHGFFCLTDISPGNLHFVRRRPDKAEVCRRLAMTHFVDDRVDVLQHLDGMPHRYLFLGGLGENPEPIDIPDWAQVHRRWDGLRGALERSAIRP